MYSLNSGCNKSDNGREPYVVFRNVIIGAMQALISLSPLERSIHIFWLSGPFVLLIERSPADIWLSSIGLCFMVRCLWKKNFEFFSTFWVRALFFFWLWCLVSATISDTNWYSFGEAFAWFRFPLFAVATVFWLGKDRRFVNAMLVSIFFATLTMCAILIAEILIVGQQGGRLSWPYDDLVSGNYIAKVGLPAFITMVALAFSGRTNCSNLAGSISILVTFVVAMTGERVNFLILVCSGFLAGISWRPSLKRVLKVTVANAFIIVAVLYFLPSEKQSRLLELFDDSQFSYSQEHFRTVMGGFEAFKTSPVVGVGPGNYRLVSHSLLQDKPHLRPDNHPHNFYVQLLAETGIIGLILGSVFVGSIILACYRAGRKIKDHIFFQTAWVIPFGFFWPVATSADFFGQWNNIFMWSSVALALCCTRWKSA